MGAGGGEILIWRGKREKAHSADSAAGSNPWLARVLIGQAGPHRCAESSRRTTFWAVLLLPLHGTLLPLSAPPNRLSTVKIFILFYCQSSQYDPFALPIILHFDVDSANWASTQQVAAVFVRPVLVGLVCISTPRQPDIVIG